MTETIWAVWPSPRSWAGRHGPRPAGPLLEMRLIAPCTKLLSLALARNSARKRKETRPQHGAPKKKNRDNRYFISVDQSPPMALPFFSKEINFQTSAGLHSQCRDISSYPADWLCNTFIHSFIYSCARSGQGRGRGPSSAVDGHQHPSGSTPRARSEDN